MTAVRHPLTIRPQVALPAIEDWRHEAECRDATGATFDPWFPESGATAKDAGTRHAAYSYARHICNGCPVREECLADALAKREFGGMRGGLDPDELRALARVPAPYDGPACRDKAGTVTGYGRHKAAHEKACAPCREASSKERRGQRARRNTQMALAS